MVDRGEVTFWNEAAANYDDLARHGVRTSSERHAWQELMAELLGRSPLQVLDLGTGTGTLAMLAADLGHEVVAVDMSEAMLEVARSKASAAALDIDFRYDDLQVLDTLMVSSFDVVMSRHVLWTLTEPVATVRLWLSRLRPGGRVVAIDGCWAVAGLSNRLRRPLGQVLARLNRAPREHGASYYDQVSVESLPLRRLVSYEDICSVFRDAGLANVEGRWLTSIDAVEKASMTLAERLLEQGQRYVVLGTAPSA